MFRTRSFQDARFQYILHVESALFISGKALKERNILRANTESKCAELGIGVFFMGLMTAQGRCPALQTNCVMVASSFATPVVWAQQDRVLARFGYDQGPAVAAHIVEGPDVTLLGARDNDRLPGNGGWERVCVEWEGENYYMQLLKQRTHTHNGQCGR